MKDIEVVVKQTAGKIDCNFDELKESLRVQMSAYTDMTVTEDAIPDAKSDLATLRKIRKAVDDKRKEIKREYNKPYVEFEIKVKELLEEIDKPIEQIDTQIKMFNEERVLKKRERCKEIYKEQIGDYEKFLPYESVAKTQWDNASYSETDVRYDISESVAKIKNDIEVIKSLKSEIEETLMETYIKSGNDLATTVARNSQYIADKNIISEKAKEKDEVKVEEKVIEKPKTANKVHFIVDEADEQAVKNALDFSSIKYEIVKE